MTPDIETIGPAPIDPRPSSTWCRCATGCELATDVYLPDGAGRPPAVLVRLPYDKNGRYCWMPFIARHFTGRGYAFVVQDVRGKFRSEGEPIAFVHELARRLRHDRLDRAQPWCNGDVGMWGDCYYGFTQWAAVASRPPRAQGDRPARHDRRHRAGSRA